MKINRKRLAELLGLAGVDSDTARKIHEANDGSASGRGHGASSENRTVAKAL